MEQIGDPQNFRFCAIPQVMAVGTLALCYNNPKVFTGTASAPRPLHDCSICTMAYKCLYIGSLHSQDSPDDSLAACMKSGAQQRLHQDVQATEHHV